MAILPFAIQIAGNMSQYWTETVHKLDPYIPGEQPQDQQYIKLNTNENPYPPSPQVIAAIEQFDMDRLKLYPDPESTVLRQELARHFDVGSDNIFMGNGSDEVLAHCFQAFFKHGKPLLFPDISYSFYPVYCGLYDISYQTIPLTSDFSININDYFIDNGGIIFPNPNAPTSRLLALDQIEVLCEKNASVVIVDEAYIDFGGESAIALTHRFDNLLVTQTFSKSRSLAGLRLGYAVGHADLIEGLNRIKNSFNSYPVDAIAQAAALASVKDQAYMSDCCDRIIKTRNDLTKALLKLGFEVLPSAANFIFVQHPQYSAESLYLSLKDRGVLVRYFNKPRIDNYLRITVGTDSEIATLITTLSHILD